MMQQVYIIILNWNRAKDTIECLKSLLKIKGTKAEVQLVLVDNASSDNSIEEIQKNIPNDSFHLIQNTENLGFAEGNNIGIKYALDNGADYVMLLNNDTEVSPSLMDGLLRTFEEYKNAGAISPKIYFAKGFEFHKDRYKEDELGNVIWYAGGDIDWNNVYGSNHGVDEIDEGQFEKVYETDFTTGCCMIVPKRVIEDVGMLDENYYLYLEDSDWCRRIKRKGYKILYTPYGHLWHKVSQSSTVGGELNDYFITRNRLLFGMKYAPFRSKIALIRESIRFMIHGRKWQRTGARDFYLGRFGKGSWK